MAAPFAWRWSVGLPGRASEVVAELVRNRKRHYPVYMMAVMFQLLLARRMAVTERSFELVFSTLSFLTDFELLFFFSCLVPRAFF